MPVVVLDHPDIVVLLNAFLVTESVHPTSPASDPIRIAVPVGCDYPDHLFLPT